MKSTEVREEKTVNEADVPATASKERERGWRVKQRKMESVPLNEENTVNTE